MLQFQLCFVCYCLQSPNNSRSQILSLIPQKIWPTLGITMDCVPHCPGTAKLYKTLPRDIIQVQIMYIAVKASCTDILKYAFLHWIFLPESGIFYSPECCPKYESKYHNVHGYIGWNKATFRGMKNACKSAVFSVCVYDYSEEFWCRMQWPRNSVFFCNTFPLDWTN